MRDRSTLYHTLGVAEAAADDADRRPGRKPSRELNRPPRSIGGVGYRAITHRPTPQFDVKMGSCSYRAPQSIWKSPQSTIVLRLSFCPTAFVVALCAARSFVGYARLGSVNRA